jgi:hypothetical protein
MTKEFVYRPTKSFYKIRDLLRNDSNLFIIQGGQGASKTISILMLLIDLVKRQQCDITICSAESSKLSDTALRDWAKIVDDWNLVDLFKYNASELTYTNKQNKAYVEFIGLDKKDIGKGRRRDVIYINEANKITLQQFSDISARAKIVILDYNPDGVFWANELINDKNFINVTYLDNEFLPKQEIYNIEDYKRKGYYEDGTIRNEFWANKWRVYGKGEIGSVEGRIYYWKPIDYLDYLKIQSKVYYGVDWGKVDPFAIIEAKYHDGKLYVHELNYDSEDTIRMKMNSTELSQINNSEDETIVTHTFKKLGISKNAQGITDNNYPSKVRAIQSAGWEQFISIGGKWKNVDRIAKINDIEVYYTSCSKNIENEQFTYCYAKDKFGRTLEEPIDANDHCFDSNTLINTLSGLKKIKNIKTTDYVLTTNGYQKVLRKFNNGIKKVNVYRLQLNTFYIYLHCTETHKIKIGEQWIQAKDLCNHLTEKITICMMEKDISANQTKDCTLLNGSFITEKFLKDFTYTTKTKIHRTTISKTLNLSKAKNIYENMDLSEQKKIKHGIKTLLNKVGKKLRNGTPQKRVLNGIDKTQSNAILDILNLGKENVKFVNQNLKPIQSFKNFAQENAYQKTDGKQELTTSQEIASSAKQNLPLTNIQSFQLVDVHVERSYNTNVWDIMVNNNHEYFANGVLVHNCINGIEYIVQDLCSQGIIKK